MVSYPALRDFRYSSGLEENLAERADNLVVQWGHQDNYEIVRKVGRGKYSEVCGQTFTHSYLFRKAGPDSDRSSNPSTFRPARNASSKF